MNKFFFQLFIASLLVSFLSCSSYDKILKSNDKQLQLTAAKKYYEGKKYLRAIMLFDAIAPHYRGTTQSEEILYLTAMSYFGNKDYFSASSLFETYVKNYPNGQFTEESAFLSGVCHYKESPDVRLDQAETKLAIDAFALFIEMFPGSPKAPEALSYLKELNEKLAEKAFLNAQLYHNLGNYLGNNYISAIITANNALKDFPNTKFKEDLYFLILDSKFQQAEQSVAAKRTERYNETLDEYYNFISIFPESKFKKEAERIYNTTKKQLKNK